MKRTALVFTASALSLAMSVAFGAGMGSEAGSTAAQQQPSAAAQISPANTYRASDLMDLKVMGPDGKDLGKISELIVDKDGKVSDVVLRESGTLGMGEKKYVVPWDRVSIVSPKEARIDVNRDALSSEFAAFDEGQYEEAMKKESEKKEQKESPPSGEQPAEGGSSGSYR